MLTINKQRVVKQGVSLPAGTCLHFCPPEEAKSRKEQRRLHVLEVSPRQEHSGKFVPVKEFVRSGAGHVTPVPSDLRPLSVLIDVITYLVKRVCERTDQPWWIVYEFVSNRLKSIRQDITYQQLTGPDTDYIFQLAVRFHLYSQSRLWSCPVEKFDPKLNRDSLQQCLLKVIRQGHLLYPEFEAYHLLANLGSEDSLQHALELSRDIRSQPCVDRAMCISKSYLENNYIRWFRLVAISSPLEQAAVLPYISAMRRSALAVVCRAHTSKNATLPIRTLCKWLLLSNVEQMARLCSAYGLEVNGDVVNIKRGAFTVPAKGTPEDDLNCSDLPPPSQLIMAECVSPQNHK